MSYNCMVRRAKTPYNRYSANVLYPQQPRLSYKVDYLNRQIPVKGKKPKPFPKKQSVAVWMQNVENKYRTRVPMKSIDRNKDISLIGKYGNLGRAALLRNGILQTTK